MSDDLLQRLRVHGAVPAHIAIIMDGNGRWAKGRALPRPLGHHAGMKAVREVVEGCLDAGSGCSRLFAFSQENWQRPAGEIDALMSLLEEYIAREVDEPAVQGRGGPDPGRHRPARAGRPPGGGPDRWRRPPAASALALNLCISYSARAEIARAARLLAEDVGGRPARSRARSTRTRSAAGSTPRRGPIPIS